MAQVADVLVPPNAEGTRATVLRWCKAVGDIVAKDEPLLELETDKVTVEVAAPDSGILIEILKQVNAEVSPDEVLARLSLSTPHAVVAEPRHGAGSGGLGLPRRPRRPARARFAAAVKSRGAAAAARTLACRGRHRGQRARWPHHGAGRDATCGGVRPMHGVRAMSACRTPLFAGAWPSTWCAALPRHRMSPLCSRRISRGCWHIARTTRRL
jgi:pyruvate/2-oxoglutarate dehydrogenase complex dihydrolipoamide acyltransferase (E2) component